MNKKTIISIHLLILSFVLYTFTVKSQVSNSKDSLKQPKLYDVVEVFFSSKQVLDHGVIIDSLSDFPYPISIESNANKFILNRKFGKKIVLPLDSVWGYKVLRVGFHSTPLYDNNFYRLKGAITRTRIIANDKLIIYYRGGYKAQYYYFSDNLDSEIIELTEENLKNHFKDNSCLLDQLKTLKHGWTDSALYQKNIDKKTGEFKLISIYKKCLN